MAVFGFLTSGFWSHFELGCGSYGIRVLVCRPSCFVAFDSCVVHMAWKVCSLPWIRVFLYLFFSSTLLLFILLLLFINSEKNERNKRQYGDDDYLLDASLTPQLSKSSEQSILNLQQYSDHRSS